MGHDSQSHPRSILHSDAFTVVLTPDPDHGSSARIPDLPGFVCTGSSYAEVKDSIPSAFASHVSMLLDQGQSLPRARSPIALLLEGLLDADSVFEDVRIVEAGDAGRQILAIVKQDPDFWSAYSAILGSSITWVDLNEAQTHSYPCPESGCVLCVAYIRGYNDHAVNPLI